MSSGSWLAAARLIAAIATLACVVPGFAEVEESEQLSGLSTLVRGELEAIRRPARICESVAIVNPAEDIEDALSRTNCLNVHREIKRNVDRELLSSTNNEPLYRGRASRFVWLERRRHSLWQEDRVETAAPYGRRSARVFKHEIEARVVRDCLILPDIFRSDPGAAGEFQRRVGRFSLLPSIVGVEDQHHYANKGNGGLWPAKGTPVFAKQRHGLVLQVGLGSLAFAIGIVLVVLGLGAIQCRTSRDGLIGIILLLTGAILLGQVAIPLLDPPYLWVQQRVYPASCTIYDSSPIRSSTVHT